MNTNTQQTVAETSTKAEARTYRNLGRSIVADLGSMASGDEEWNTIPKGFSDEQRGREVAKIHAATDAHFKREAILFITSFSKRIFNELEVKCFTLEQVEMIIIEYPKGLREAAAAK